MVCHNFRREADGKLRTLRDNMEQCTYRCRTVFWQAVFISGPPTKLTKMADAETARKQRWRHDIVEFSCLLLDVSHVTSRNSRTVVPLEIRVAWSNCHWCVYEFGHASLYEGTMGIAKQDMPAQAHRQAKTAHSAAKPCQSTGGHFGRVQRVAFSGDFSIFLFFVSCHFKVAGRS